tara:strand:- start:2092 stop:2319 length:228 start_codon:yes stop_codon:yes gene_type:complete
MFDTDVPIPEIVPRNNKYNLHKMQEGDSFTIFYDPEKAQKLRVAICNYSRRNNKQFTTRKTNEEGIDVLRVWRTE